MHLVDNHQVLAARIDFKSRALYVRRGNAFPVLGRSYMYVEAVQTIEKR